MSLFKSVVFRLHNHLTQLQNFLGFFSLHYHGAMTFLDCDIFNLCYINISIT